MFVASLLLLCPLGLSYTLHGQMSMMGGGRSLAEKEMTQKQMFRSLRDKFNEASKAPGFFDIPGTKVDIELYCKSNKAGNQIGDCPFAQFVQLVLMKKGLKYNIRPTLSSEKPAWLNEKYDGKLPALVHDNKVIVESVAIAEYIEKTFPHSSLTRQGAYSYQEVMEKTSGFFPALSTCLKNKDETQDATLIASVESQLDTLDELLRSTPGQYLCGIELTLADLYLLPQLFHAFIAMDHFKDTEILHLDGEPKRPAFENYFARMLDMEEFNDKRAYYNADSVINGWKVARGEA